MALHEEVLEYICLDLRSCRQLHVRRSGIFIVNFEHISHLVLVFLLLTLSRLMPAGYHLRSLHEKN